MICHAGRAHDEQLEVQCQLGQGQHAHPHQEGPDLSLLYPVVQKQWDHALNSDVGYVVIRPKSHRKVWWRCDQCPDGHMHSWQATISDRTRGRGCPQCSGRKVCKHNYLATKAPSVAAQWDYEANDGTPRSMIAQSKQMVGWHCDVCGHKWEAKPQDRVSNKKMAARSALRMQISRIRRPSSQPLQSAAPSSGRVGSLTQCSSRKLFL